VLVLNDPPERVSYEKLLATYWRQIDPTTADRMFLDTGLQYSSAIFVVGPRVPRGVRV
jgi:peptide-methionine (S)-S-oxide reductase